MTTRSLSIFIGIALLVILGVGMGSSGLLAQDKDKQVRAKWEYKVIRMVGTAGDVQLTSLGDEGWLLFSITPGQPYVKDSRVFQVGGGGTNTVNTIAYTETVYYFKRPK